MKYPYSTFFLLSFLSFLPFRSLAQIDSLEQVLAGQQDRSERLLTLNELVRQSISVDPEQGFLYAAEANELADAEGTAEERYNSHFLYARLCVISGRRLDEAETHTRQAIQVSREELEIPRKVLSAEIMLGGLYYKTNEMDKAIQLFTQAAETAHSIEDRESEYSCISNIASVYRYQDDPVNAEKYYRLSIPLLEEGDEVTKAQLYNNLGVVAQDELSGFDFLLQAHNIYQKEGAPPIYLSSVATDIGNNLMGRSDHKAALPWLLNAVRDAKDYPDSSYYYSAVASLSECNWQLGKRQEGVRNMEIVQAYFARQGDFWNQMQVDETLADYYADVGSYQRAYDMLRTSFALKDSINNKTNAEALAESNVRFATAEKEALIANQELEINRQETAKVRLLAGGLGVLALLAGIFQYFFYRQRRRKTAVDLALEAEAKETARLRELDTMKTQFFTNVSHELRTPLTLITSPLEEALGKLKQTNLKPNLELAHRNSHQLLGLINEMLDLEKLETGNISPETSTQNFEPWLRRVFFSFLSAAESKNLDWDYSFSPTAVATVETDFPKLEKMLNNLLSNALKFTPAGGKVTLSGTCNEGKLTLQVTDNGPGIPSAELSRIFERFYQSAHLPATGGTGIGLALSRRLALLLDGDLTATSKLGEGSRFELMLPVITSQATIIPEDVTPEKEETSAATVTPLSLTGDRPRLLIVEDHPDMSLYLRQSLVQEYDSVVAENGAKALELMAGQPFDLILSDVMMPVMDGFALRQKINEVSEWAGTPFIFLTARSMEADKLRGFQLGIDDYVTKPFQLAELKARMNSLLKNKNRREEHALTQEKELGNEQQLLDRAENLVRERLDDLTFTVEALAKELGYSQRQLSRVFGRLTGLTPVQFVLEVRLQHARHLLETGQHTTVAEVRYAIGIESASYFTRKFKERFGCSPRTYFG
ncbi:MAG: ATP-binding protein [Lewinella sp.]